MLNIKRVFQSPNEFEFKRNGKIIKARKLLVGKVRIAQSIRFGDSESMDAFHQLKCMKGEYEVSTYVWEHNQRGLINVGILVENTDEKSGRICEICIKQNYATHIRGGIPVDSASIGIEVGEWSGKVDSGLGDGVYPVHGRSVMFKGYNAYFIDLLLWKVRNVIVFGNKYLDEYGIVVEKSS